MGGTSFSSADYTKGIDLLRQTGKTFARSVHAAQTGNYRAIADILNPRKLKNGIRESCFAPGFDDLLSVFVSIDGTGSMDEVPFVIQKELPKLLELVTEQGITDHPNVLFTLHDDEHACPPDAAFQMSQFEIGAAELIASLNEMIIPHNGGGNRGEAYHLSLYAAARHTRLESFEKKGEKGFFFMICDEEPYYGAQNPAEHGTLPAIAKEVFGDNIEKEVTMLESLTEVCRRYYPFVIRPGHTSNGRDHSVTKMWQTLWRKAGANPEYVMEVEETDAIISTMALAIGQIVGTDQKSLVSVLKAKGATGVQSAVSATRAIVPVSAVKAVTAAKIDTGKSSGRTRLN